MEIEIFTDFTPGKSTPGSVVIPYKGVEISVSTIGNEVAVFKSRNERDGLIIDDGAVQVFHGATAESIQKAFVFVDAFKKTSGYRTPVYEEGCDLMTLQQYMHSVLDGMIIDSDGHGHPVNVDKLENPDIFINPSNHPGVIPADAVYIAWYNK